MKKIIPLSIVLFFVSAYCFSQNLIQNPDFNQGLNNWSAGNYNGGSVVPSIDTNSVLSGKNSVFLNITSPSDKNYDAQFRNGIPIIAGKYYVISFLAKAQKTKQAEIFMQNGSSAPLYLNSITIGTTKALYGPYTFASNSTSNPNIGLYLGGQDGIATGIWLDSFSVYQFNSAPVITFQSPASQTHINQNAPINFSVKVTDPAGITKVTLYDSTVKISDLTSVDSIYTFQTSSAAVGRHIFNIVAYDANSVSSVVYDTLYIDKVTGLQEKELSNGFSLYPNPTEDFLTLQGIGSLGSLSVYSASGEKVLNAGVVYLPYRLSVAGLVSGIYVLVSDLGSYRFVKK